MKRFYNPVRELVAELGFLTILPVHVYDIEAAARGLYWSPLIGLLIGLIAILPGYIPADPLLKGVSVFTLLYLLTGLLHLDGYSDFCDVLGSGLTGEDALRVLKDPRKGAKAISCSILLLIITYTSLMVLVEHEVIPIAFVNAGVYESLYLTALFGKPSPYEGLGRMFIRFSRETVFLNIATISIVIAIGIGIQTYATVMAFGVGLIASVIAMLYSTRKASSILGMVNGDVIGFSLELARVVALLSFAFVVEWD